MHGRSAGNETVSYTVYAPPSIVSLGSKLINSTLELRVLLLNPTPQTVSGTLEYRVLANGTSLYSDVLDVTIPPGKKGLSFTFTVPTGTNVTYSFKLNALGRTSVKEGSLWVSAPKPSPTETETPTTTSLNMTTTTKNASGSFSWWPVVGLFLIALTILLYYQNRPKERRTRKGPKRQSPLGRFKRPKPPKFQERDSLPKKR